uniref:Small integral membrane protein 5 n=1 Tax=Poecilia reticulata TaxID=8081 RepID=A0A3P9Q1A5_POERE
MDAKQEFSGILQRVWSKLLSLPQATPLESGAFSILVLFIVTVLFLMLLSCFHCCCCGKPKYQGSRVQPFESV